MAYGRLDSLIAYADRIVASLAAYDPEQIILFGSVARGEIDEYSDIDLIVVKETEKDFLDRLSEARKYLPKRLPQDVEADIDVKVYTPEQLKQAIEIGNPFFESALGDGKVVYERGKGVRPSQAAPRTKWAWDGGIRFVRQPLRVAHEWLGRAGESLGFARSIVQLSSWPFLCFHSQQVAELSLKAFLYLQGHPPFLTHSIQQLVERCAAEDPAFLDFRDLSEKIGNYYITTRYPNSDNMDPEPMSQMFSEADALEALDYAERIFGLVHARVASASEDLLNHHDDQETQ